MIAALTGVKKEKSHQDLGLKPSDFQGETPDAHRGVVAVTILVLGAPTAFHLRAHISAETFITSCDDSFKFMGPRSIAEMILSRPHSFAVLFPDSTWAGGGWGPTLKRRSTTHQRIG